jgi:hypothetical protein
LKVAPRNQTPTIPEWPTINPIRIEL